MSDQEQKAAEPAAVAPEAPKARTIDDLHREYSQMCSKAGHTQYQISVLKKDLELLNEQLKALNLEAASLSAKNESEKKS